MAHRDLVLDNQERLKRIKRAVARLERQLKNPNNPHRACHEARNLQELAVEFYSVQFAASMIKETREDTDFPGPRA